MRDEEEKQRVLALPRGLCQIPNQARKNWPGVPVRRRGRRESLCGKREDECGWRRGSQCVIFSSVYVEPDEGV
ncbi:hypothetical protein COLO4_07126 [Corchorus olitorius]|uniref:Uncharacterized protein n=1 Tax=Corchorus olitorius TaxID=93759 RepID=A0A1R3KKV9_9ROSI|nr:hypothetical protein COLO4_07126 [Corchorus olitorius]